MHGSKIQRVWHGVQRSRWNVGCRPNSSARETRQPMSETVEGYKIEHSKGSHRTRALEAP